MSKHALGVQLQLHGAEDLSQLPNSMRVVIEILCLWLARYNQFILELTVEESGFWVPRWILREHEDDITQWFMQRLGIDVIEDSNLHRYWFGLMRP